MTDHPTIALSIPGRFVANLRLSGSIVPLEEIFDRLEDYPLRAAAALIRDKATEASATVAFVARPEMFHGAVALAWLKDKIPRVMHHVTLSDGSSAGMIPTLPNYLFPYGQFYNEDHQGLIHLEEIAGESLRQFTGIINYNVPGAQTRIEIRANSTDNFGYFPEYPAGGWRILDIADPVDETAATNERSFPELIDHIRTYATSSVIFCSETALQFSEFLNLVCHEVSRSFANPGSLLLLQMPVARQPQARMAVNSAARSFYKRLRQSAISLPPVAVSNVVVLTAPLPPEILAGIRLASLLTANDYPIWWYAWHDASYVPDVHIWTPPNTGISRGVAHEVIASLCNRLPKPWRRR